MTTFKRLWLQRRSLIARILRVPMIAAVVIFTVCNVSMYIQEFMAGFDEVSDVVLWAVCTYGTIVTPLVAFRSWTEVFHDGADAFSITITSKVWGGGSFRSI